MSQPAAWRKYVDPLLLLPRGAGLILAMYGVTKLLDVEGTRDYFASLNLPMPGVSAVGAGLTEAVGGLLMAIGLHARLAAFPVMITMLVAYASAHRGELVFTSRPFPFFVAAVIVLALGAGRYSVDGRRARPRAG